MAYSRPVWNQLKGLTLKGPARTLAPVLPKLSKRRNRLRTCRAATGPPPARRRRPTRPVVPAAPSFPQVEAVPPEAPGEDAAQSPEGLRVESRTRTSATAAP